MKKQIRLCSVPYQDPESVQKKSRKKISQKEIKKRGDFFTEKAKSQVEVILKNLNQNERR
jgi:hypothetical protein